MLRTFKDFKLWLDELSRLLSRAANAGNDAQADAQAQTGADASLAGDDTGQQLSSEDERVDKDQLRSDLICLLTAVGIYRETDEEKQFHLWADVESSRKELARSFQRLVHRANPLDPTRCPPDLRARLNALARVRWAARKGAPARSLTGKTWSQLTVTERQDVRDMLRHLAQFHAAQVRRGAPRKAEMDTLLMGLGEIFIAHAGLACHPLQLPHDEKSLFINFCGIVLAESCESEAAASLSRRWKRLKQREAEAGRSSRFRRRVSAVSSKPYILQ